MNDGVRQSVLAHLDVFDGRLDEHWVLVIDVGHRDPHIGGPGQRRDAVVGRRHREVVRVVRQTVVVQSPTCPNISRDEWRSRKNIVSAFRQIISYD